MMMIILDWRHIEVKMQIIIFKSLFFSFLLRVVVYLARSRCYFPLWARSIYWAPNMVWPFVLVFLLFNLFMFLGSKCHACAHVVGMVVIQVICLASLDH